MSLQVKIDESESSKARASTSESTKLKQVIKSGLECQEMSNTKDVSPWRCNSWGLRIWKINLKHVFYQVH